ncbi:esterase/lipase family protein [Actinomycetospora sp. CA-101289]|uniref:esterase/lipase family protein n=1 Tax=Actinomycetospora sp. CA-101289 TaxID=3239893 RepID=UPI003D9579DA
MARGRTSRARAWCVALGVALAVVVSAAPAAAAPVPQLPLPVPQPAREYAPLDRAGPALQVGDGALAEALDCTADVDDASRPPVLLIPGTTLTAEENFSWNYERAFATDDRPYCALTLPNHAMSDIQVSAEYVVAAIRAVHRRSGQRLAIVGFSQGGMIGRWALRFWPDTRAQVGEVVGIDPSNHGTLDAYPVCAAAGCAPAFWQQQTLSAFTTALNSRAETFAGIDYTSLWTPTDEVVVPNLGPAPSSRLTTGEGRRANISTFDVCPGHVAEHLSMGSFDAVAYALVVDALDHDGPAATRRIDRAACLAPFQEGVDPVAFPGNLASYVAGAGFQVATYPHVLTEPALAPYVLARQP